MAENTANSLSSTALRIDVAAQILSRAGSRLVLEEMLRNDIEVGPPTNADGTLNLVNYAACLRMASAISFTAGLLSCGGFGRGLLHGGRLFRCHRSRPFGNRGSDPPRGPDGRREQDISYFDSGDASSHVSAESEGFSQIRIQRDFVGESLKSARIHENSHGAFWGWAVSSEADSGSSWHCRRRSTLRL